MRKDKLNIMLVIIYNIPVILGGIIYLAFRTNTLLMFKWVETLGLYNGLINIRAGLQGLKGNIPEYVIYSLPTGLWAYSFMMDMFFVWGYTRQGIIWYSAIAIIIIGSELLQKFNIMPGNFDVKDLITNLAFIMLMIITIILRRYTYEGKSNNIIPCYNTVCNAGSRKQ